MSGYRTSPRFDVVASTRRSWTRAQKLIIVGEIGVDGATVSDVARRHGLHANLLFRWRRELLDAGPGTAPAPRVADGRPDPSASAQPVFVPLALTPPAPTPPAPTPPIEPRGAEPRETAEAGRIEVVLAGGRRVQVGADVDTAALVRIIEALEKRR